MFSLKKTTENKKVLNDNNNKSSDYLKNPEILEVNLVKDELIVFFDWNKNLFITFLVLIVSGLFVFQIYLGLDYWEKRENEKAILIEEETNKVKRDIIALNEKSKDALSFKDKSSAFSDLLNNHIYWTRFLTWLESNTLSTVKYTGFNGSLSGVYSLSASAPSYAEASWQVKVFSENSYVNKVSVKSVTLNRPEDYFTNTELQDAELDAEPEKANFLINLEVKPEIFKKK